MTSVADTTTGGTTAPRIIEYTNADVDRAMQRPKLRSKEWYRFKVAHATAGAWPSGDSYIDMLVNPTDEQGKGRQPSGNFRLNVPVPGGQYFHGDIDKWHDFLNAGYPDKYPVHPKFDRSVGCYVTADGRQVAKDQADAIKRATTVAILAAVTEYQKDTRSLSGEYFFGQTDDSEYRRVKVAAQQPPPGVTVRYSDFADTENV